MKIFVRSVMVLSLAFALSADAHAQRAVLVGVSKFDHLNITPLEGPPNDVALMAAALSRRGIPAAKIVQLTDTARSDLLPTRANILRVLGEQARMTKPGEVVVIYFSGHGAQVPQVTPVAAGNWVEPDGLDEVFLTRDTKLWDRNQQKVEGAILDDEIGAALAQFTKKGARVWAIFDTCHAGDMARAVSLPHNSSTVWRGVNPLELGVPAEALAQGNLDQKAKSGSGLASRGAMRAGLMSSGRTDKDGARKEMVLFYASQSDEAAPEELFKRPDIDVFSGNENASLRFGVFTWAVADALGAATSHYRDIAHLIARRYSNRSTPTPLIAGPLDGRILR